MISLKIIKGPNKRGKSFPVETGESKTLGRSRACDIRLSAKGVSKQHARLTVLPGGKTEIEDLGSSNGTFVNGVLVKKHLARPGDYVGISDYVIQLGVEAPNVDAGFGGPGMAQAAGAEGFESFQGAPQPSSVSEVKALEESAAQKIQIWLEGNIFPWAQKLSDRFDMRYLVFCTMIIWLITVVILTAAPFAIKANEQIQMESTRVGELFARQLARINQQAIIDQRYRDLVHSIDAQRGQTIGVINSYILDSQKGTVLAPSNLAGETVPPFAAASLQKDRPAVEIDPTSGRAAISHPIKVGVERNGKVINSVAAVAFVYFNTQHDTFSFVNLLDHIVNSLLIALIFTFIVLLFLFEWIEGSISRFSLQLNQSMQGDIHIEELSVQWPKLNQLIRDTGTLLGRASGAAVMDVAQSSSWAQAVTSTNMMPAASFDSSLVVTGWNPLMESLLGIRAHIAIGNDISGASRDLAFESTVRNLAEESLSKEWKPLEVPFEMSGYNYKVSMVFGDGNYLLSVQKELEEE